MIKHPLSYFFFGIGALGLMFALGRTYYLVWKSKKERETRGSQTRLASMDEKNI